MFKFESYTNQAATMLSNHLLELVLALGNRIGLCKNRPAHDHQGRKPGAKQNLIKTITTLTDFDTVSLLAITLLRFYQNVIDDFSNGFLAHSFGFFQKA